MFFANMESESFSWYACGNTEIEAKESILNKWNDSDGIYRSPFNSVEEMEEYYGINVMELKPGECIYE